jgi:hypothetical protein
MKFHKTPTFIGVLGLLGVLALGCLREPRLTYRLVLPDGYIGWVRIDFGVDSAPAVFREANRQRLAEFKLGEDGHTRTSDNMVILFQKTEYEFYYEGSAGLKPVPEELVSHDLNAGGITAMAQDYDQSIKPMSWYFFVGPRSYRAKKPISILVKTGTPLPVPGRIREESK